MLACGEREAMVMAPPTLHDSAVLPCFHGCLGFLHTFPTTISSLTSPPSVSLQSSAAFTLRLLHNPQTPAPSCCAFQGTSVPVRGMYGCNKDCLILIPFRLPQMSYFTHSLKCFSSDSAAAAAKSLQSCQTLCDPIDGSPPGFSVHRIL